MVKEVVEKLNKKYGSKIAWNGAEYIKYKESVESARIENISSLIIQFKYWSVFSEEEENHLDKIIEELENYLEYLGE